MTTSLTFGLVVSSQAADTVARLEALAEWMHTAGVSLTARPAATYKELVTSIREGTSDLAWLPPVPYAWLAEAVTPIGSIVRKGETSYASAIVVREGSKRSKLSELSGVRAGWVDPWSAAGYVVPRLMLSRAGVRPRSTFARETFYGSHREALLALKANDCDVVGTFARMPASGSTPIEGAWTEINDLRIRVLSTFSPIPGDVLAARRNLGPAEFEAAQHAFRKAFGDDEGRTLTQALFDGSELSEGALQGHAALRRAYESALGDGLFD